MSVFTDSQYLQQGMDRRVTRWRTCTGWRNSQGEPLANRDLWEELIRVSDKHHVTWHCDRLAKAAARSAARAAATVIPLGSRPATVWSLDLSRCRRHASVKPVHVGTVRRAADRRDWYRRDIRASLLPSTPFIVGYGFPGSEDTKARMCLSTSRGLLTIRSCVPERLTTRSCPAKDLNQLACLRTRSRVNA